MMLPGFYRQTLETCLERVWRQARDPKTGLFDRGGIGLYGKGELSVLNQAAFVQMFALLAWPEERLPDAILWLEAVPGIEFR